MEHVYYLKGRSGSTMELPEDAIRTLLYYKEIKFKESFYTSTNKMFHYFEFVAGS